MDMDFEKVLTDAQKEIFEESKKHRSEYPPLK